ncbi:MAG: GLUG motif-containing protein [Planctomycetota bacterium]|jgi:hypothetical protein
MKSVARFKISLSLFIIFLLPLCTFAKYSGGDGSAEYPFQIATPGDLNDIGNHLDDWHRNFIMVNDINLAAYIGSTFQLIGIDYLDPFTGVFDGNGHTISNFAYVFDEDDYMGLFRYVSGINAEIKDLGLIDPNIDAGTGDSVAALVGSLSTGAALSSCFTQGGTVRGTSDNGGLGALAGSNHGIITDCYSSTKVIGQGNFSGSVGTGGLIGSNDGQVSNCYSTADVNGNNNYVGGLIGYNSDDGVIFNCYATGNVQGGNDLGGLVGSNWGSVSLCSAAGNVSGNWFVGGLAGKNRGTITESCSTSYVTGDDAVGGFVGNSYPGIISYCFASGNVTRPSTGGTFKDVGGFAGYNGDIIYDCYASGNVSGGNYTGGFVASNQYEISNCYSTGTVSGEGWVGAFAGTNVLGTLNDSFWDTESSELGTGVGTGSSSGLTGRTTDQMQTKSTFTGAGWDFLDGTYSNSIWRMCLDLVSYPKLKWEFDRTADFLCPDGTEFIDYSHFAGHWLSDNCPDTNDCNSTDLDFSGAVDGADLDIFKNYWLFGK